MQLVVGPPPQTQYIGHRGGRTLFHAARVSRSLGIEPNLFVTINFWETSLTLFEVSAAFLEMRRKFVRWIKNPPKRAAVNSVQPTFLWVLENPEDLGRFHAHWLIFVPPGLHGDFAIRLNGWLRSVTSQIFSAQPIHVEPVSALLGVTEYMLKGQIPAIARYYGIEPVYQGWIPGKKRSGCSMNIGPTCHRKACDEGHHKHPERWRVNKYPPALKVV